MSEMSLSEAMRAALNDSVPVVRRVFGGWDFDVGDGRWDYDISDAMCRDEGSALRWIEHLAAKSWVTTRHLLQFASLAADHFKAPY